MPTLKPKLRLNCVSNYLFIVVICLVRSIKSVSCFERHNMQPALNGLLSDGIMMF